MKVDELEPMINNILKRTESLIRKGDRRLIFTETLFHQQFAQMVANHYARKKIDAWERGMLVPEHPTKVKYAWKEFGMNRPKTTKKLALHQGQRARFDFVVRDDPRIHVEWRGPGMYTARDVAMDLTKLLMLEGPRPIKVFAAIIASSRAGDDAHIHQLTSRFYDALEFTQVILDLPDLKRSNLYAYIATVPDEGAQKFIWGKV